MSRTFLDTNVLVYAVDGADPSKQRRAQEILARGDDPDTLVISTQVVQEFYVTVVRKLAQPLSEVEAEERARELCALPIVTIDADLVLEAIATSRRERLAFWDALIVEAALRAGCRRLWSEDLQHGRVFAERLRVENPFLELPPAGN